MRNGFRLLVVVGVLAGAPSLSALAQQQNVPRSADPGRIEQQFQLPAVPRSSGAPVVTVPEDDRRPATAGSIRLRLSEVVITGNTVFRIEDLMDAWRPLLGTESTLAAVFDVAEALTARYRNAGYILSQVIVPAQEIRNGSIRLQVIEGYVAETRVDGPAAAPLAAVRRYLVPLTATRPMTAAALERALLLINEIPGVSAETVLSPAADQTGGALLSVAVKTKPVDAFASVDNRGTKFLGPYQYTLGGDVNGALTQQDRLSARLVTTAPTRELRYGEIGYETVLTPTGDRIRLRFSRAATRPADSVTQLEVEGSGTTASVGWERPLIRSRAENLSLEGRFTYRDSETRLLSADFSDDRLRSLALLGSYDYVDRWRGITLFQGGLWQGLDILNESTSGSSRLSRTGGRSDFTKATAALSRLQKLIGPVSLLTALNGQYAFSQLLAPEEFGVGGAQFGHAYDAAEISGDHGLAGLAEVQYGGEVSGSDWLRAYQLFASYETGATWRIAERASGRDTLASASVGARLQLPRNTSATLELAKPLTIEPAAEGNDLVRFFFSLGIRY